MSASPVRAYLALALPLGLAYALVNAPFAGLEEVSHLARAHALSRGVLAPSRGVEGGATYQAPARYEELAARTEAVRADRAQRFEEAWLAGELSRREGADLSAAVRAPTALSLPPAYLPYVPGMWLARALDLSPLVTLYLARGASALAATALSAWAIALAGELGWLFLALALVPATTLLAAMVSSSALTHALALVLFALLLRARSPEPKQAATLPLAVCTVCLLACTQPAFTLLALALPALSPASAGPWTRYRWAGLSLFLSMILLVAWSPSMFDLDGLGRLLKKVFAGAGRSLRILSYTAFKRGDDHFLELLALPGVLTQQARFAASIIALGYAQLLLALSVGALHARRADPGGRHKTRFVVTAALAVAAALWLTGFVQTARSERVLKALCGYWFTPLLASFSALLWYLRPVAARWLSRRGGRRIVVIALMLHFYCLFALYGRYYAPLTPVLPF